MYYVYILTNQYNTVVYTGVTNNLERRLYEHRNHLVDGFTKRYNLNKLIYFETTSDVRSAIEREKQIKGWTRAKKNALIESVNPKWNDISLEWKWVTPVILRHFVPKNRTRTIQSTTRRVMRFLISFGMTPLGLVLSFWAQRRIVTHPAGALSFWSRRLKNRITTKAEYRPTVNAILRSLRLLSMTVWQ